MTVREIIDYLQQQDADLPVVFTDEEANALDEEPHILLNNSVLGSEE